MANGNILSDFGINLLEEEIDDVIFQTNEFLTDATFTGSQGPFWWILQMCMALAALFAIIMAAGMAYKMMVKQEPLDILKLFRPLAVSIILCWWYPPADTGMAGRLEAAEATGVFWTSSRTYRIVSAVIPMTCTRPKPRRYRTSSKKYRSLSTCATRCTRAYRHVPMSPTRARPTPT